MTQHVIVTDEDDGRAYWECSCGRGGSAHPERVDIASDKHIGDGDTRIDRSSGRQW